MALPARSPSEVRFAALLAYSPDGIGEVSRRSAQVVTNIKHCLPGYLDRVGQRFEEALLAGHFLGFLGEGVLLVPAPRRAPFKSKDSAWPALSICEQLMSRRLAVAVDPILERHTPVPKSAMLRKGAERPGPADHLATIRCLALRASPPARITVVDDVVTRGATLFACADIVAAHHPDCEVRTLAVVRTMSKQEVASVLAPVEGRISVHNGVPRRHP